MCLIFRKLILTRSIAHLKRSSIGSLRANGKEELYGTIRELSNLLLQDAVLEIMQAIGRPGRTYPNIIVRRSTEGRNMRTIPWIDDRITSIDQLVNRTLTKIILHGEVTPYHLM